jgi:catechol 2,3-dioxygenase-like lactoylglutathione lyase family enzyme
MHALAFDHVGIVVSNIDASIDFFRNLFGWEVHSRRPARAEHYQGLEVAFLSCGGEPRIELIGPSLGPDGAEIRGTSESTHIGLTTPSLDLFEARCRKFHLAVSRVVDSNGRTMSARVVGPGGSMIEVCERKPQVSTSGVQEDDT